MPKLILAKGPVIIQQVAKDDGDGLSLGYALLCKREARIKFTKDVQLPIPLEERDLRWQFEDIPADVLAAVETIVGFIESKVTASARNKASALCRDMKITLEE